MIAFQTDKDLLRVRLVKLLERVPDSVKNGNLNTVLQYKLAVKTAYLVLDKGRSTTLALQSACSALAIFS